MTTTPRQNTEPAGTAPPAGAQAAAKETAHESTPASAHESALLAELAEVLHQVRQGRFDVRLPRRAGARR